MSGYDVKFPDDPTRDEDLASQASLALAPWVEQQARPIREAHFAARQMETEAQIAAKVSKWRNGRCVPREGSHRA